MKFREKTHVTELLFSVALLCVFLITGVLVIMTGADVYQKTVRSSDLNYNMQTSLSYIVEKIRQGDENGGITLGETEDGVPALLISSRHQDADYTTYIYACGGEIRELFVRQDAAADSADGTPLLETGSLTFEELDNRLLRITVADTEGGVSSVLIHPSSRAAEGGAS